MFPNNSPSIIYRCVIHSALIASMLVIFPQAHKTAIWCILLLCIANRFIHKFEHGLCQHLLSLRFQEATGRYRWQSGLRPRPEATYLLGLRARIPPGTWMSVSCECCVSRCRGSRLLADNSTRGILPSAVCHWVWSYRTVPLLHVKWVRDGENKEESTNSSINTLKYQLVIWLTRLFTVKYHPSN